MSEIIKVGMADLKVCKSPNAVTTLGLGSCVGIAVRDPDSTSIRNNSNIPKFADTGIEELVRQIVSAGANRNRLVAKIAGGAQMFSFQQKADMVRVGDRNVEAVKKKLQQMKIPILASDTGKNYGRTVIFYPETGDFVIRRVGKGDSVI